MLHLSGPVSSSLTSWSGWGSGNVKPGICQVPYCINHISFSPVFWCFDLWGLLIQRDCPSQFLVKQLAHHPTHQVQTNKSRAQTPNPSHLFIRFSHFIPDHYLSAPITLGQVLDNEGQPLGPEPADIQTSPSKLFTLPHPFLPMETTTKALLAHLSLCSFWSLTDPGASLCAPYGPPWHGLLPPLRTVTNYHLNGHHILAY